MTTVEEDVDDRFAGIDIDSLLNRSQHRPLSYGRKKALYEAPEFIQRLNGEETVMEGQSLCIECKVRGFPVPTLRWFKDDEEILDHPRIHVESNGTGGYSLIIDKVSKGDEAAYRCRAENVEGASSSYFFLSVKAKPKSKKKREQKSSPNRRTVSFPPMFATIVEKVEEEEKQSQEQQKLPPSPMTEFYYALTLKGRQSWPTFVGDWAFTNDGHSKRRSSTGSMNTDHSSEDDEVFGDHPHVHSDFRDEDDDNTDEDLEGPPPPKKPLFFLPENSDSSESDTSPTTDGIIVFNNNILAFSSPEEEQLRNVCLPKEQNSIGLSFQKEETLASIQMGFQEKQTENNQLDILATRNDKNRTSQQGKVLQTPSKDGEIPNIAISTSSVAETSGNPEEQQYLNYKNKENSNVDRRPGDKKCPLDKKNLGRSAVIQSTGMEENSQAVGKSRNTGDVTPPIIVELWEQQGVTKRDQTGLNAAFLSAGRNEAPDRGDERSREDREPTPYFDTRCLQLSTPVFVVKRESMLTDAVSERFEREPTPFFPEDKSRSASNSTPLIGSSSLNTPFVSQTTSSLKNFTSSLLPPGRKNFSTLSASSLTVPSPAEAFREVRESTPYYSETDPYQYIHHPDHRLTEKKISIIKQSSKDEDFITVEALSPTLPPIQQTVAIKDNNTCEIKPVPSSHSPPSRRSPPSTLRQESMSETLAHLDTTGVARPSTITVSKTATTKTVSPPALNRSTEGSNGSDVISSLPLSSGETSWMETASQQTPKLVNSGMRDKDSDEYSQKPTKVIKDDQFNKSNLRSSVSQSQSTVSSVKTSTISLKASSTLSTPQTTIAGIESSSSHAPTISMTEPSLKTAEPPSVSTMHKVVPVPTLTLNSCINSPKQVILGQFVSSPTQQLVSPLPPQAPIMSTDLTVSHKSMPVGEFKEISKDLLSSNSNKASTENVEISYFQDGLKGIEEKTHEMKKVIPEKYFQASPGNKISAPLAELLCEYTTKLDSSSLPSDSKQPQSQVLGQTLPSLVVLPQHHQKKQSTEVKGVVGRCMEPKPKSVEPKPSRATSRFSGFKPGLAEDKTPLLPAEVVPESISSVSDKPNKYPEKKALPVTVKRSFKESDMKQSITSKSMASASQSSKSHGHVAAAPSSLSSTKPLTAMTLTSTMPLTATMQLTPTKPLISKMPHTSTISSTSSPLNFTSSDPSHVPEVSNVDTSIKPFPLANENPLENIRDKALPRENLIHRQLRVSAINIYPVEISPEANSNSTETSNADIAVRKKTSKSTFSKTISSFFKPKRKAKELTDTTSEVKQKRSFFSRVKGNKKSISNQIEESSLQTSSGQMAPGPSADQSLAGCSPFGQYTLEGFAFLLVLTMVCLQMGLSVERFLCCVLVAFYAFCVLRILGILK